MTYIKTALLNKGSEILKKLKKVISIEEIKRNFTHIDIFMLDQDEVLDDDILVKLFEVARSNNININSLIYRHDFVFTKVPRTPSC